METLSRYDPQENKFIIGEGCNSTLPNLIWVVTDRCSNNCPFCFQPKTYVDFNYILIDDYIQMFQELGVQKIDLSGGEPLLYPRLFEICTRLRSNNISMTITTNGVSSRDETNQLIEQRNSFSRILLSINGYDEHSHDELCTVRGTYGNTINLIELLKKFKYKGVRINTVVTKILLGGKDKILSQIIAGIKPDEWCLIEPHPENKKSTFDDYKISRDAFDSICNKIQERMKHTSVKILIRSTDNYNGYWVLYPNGTIRKHVSADKKPLIYEFVIDNIGTLKNVIKEKIWLPV